MAVFCWKQLFDCGLVKGLLVKGGKKAGAAVLLDSALPTAVVWRQSVGGDY